MLDNFLPKLQILTGYARVENAEFYHMAQEGYVNYEDPRFALAYLGTGQVTANKPSYIKKVRYKDIVICYGYYYDHYYYYHYY